MRNFTVIAGLALLAGCLTNGGSSGTTGSSGLCQSAGESCSLSADCCSGFACENGKCEFVGGNGGGSGGGGSSGGQGSTGSGSSSGGTGTTRATTGGSSTASQGSSSAGTTGHGTGSSGAASSSHGTTGTTGAGTSGGTGGSGTLGTSGTASSGGSSTSGGTANGPYPAGWPKWHYDNADQGLSPADTSSNSGQVLWTYSVGVPMVGTGLIATIDPNPTYMSSPVVDASGDVYQLGMNGTFYAVGSSGNLLWSTTLLSPNPDVHTATATLANDGTLYVESGTDGATAGPAQLYHIDAATGHILFQAGPPTGQNCVTGTCSNADGFDVPPTLSLDGLLFDGDDFGQVVTYTLAGGGSFTQANEVILQFYGERVAVALDANDNSYWCSLGVCFGVSSPAAGFTQLSGWTSTGAPIGSSGSAGSNWINSDLAYDQSHSGWLMVEAGTQSGSTGSTEIVAMDPVNGSLHWDTKLPSGPTLGTFNLLTEEGIFSADVGNAAPAIGADGTVYVGNVDGLYAINGLTGAINFSYKPSQDTGANADVDTAPAIGGDGTIFFGTAGGTFYAIDSSGNERFHLKTTGRISSSPAIGPDGTVYFVSDDGSLYAVK